MRKALGLTSVGQILLISDALLILLGLVLAEQLRQALPFGRDISAAGTELPWPVYVLTEVVWLAALAGWGAYNPRRIHRWYTESGTVLMGAATGTMLLAGVLYLTFREVSRLEFSYFFVVSVFLLLAWRALMRIYFRTAGHARAGGMNRVLIVGAGDLGAARAPVLIEHGPVGLPPAGFPR